jgi:hypothetical protein
MEFEPLLFSAGSSPESQVFSGCPESGDVPTARSWVSGESGPKSSTPRREVRLRAVPIPRVRLQVIPSALFTVLGTLDEAVVVAVGAVMSVVVRRRWGRAKSLGGRATPDRSR